MQRERKFNNTWIEGERGKWPENLKRFLQGPFPELVYSQQAALQQLNLTFPVSSSSVARPLSEVLNDTTKYNI